MQEIVKKLIEKNKKISTMESCTGGALASAITNIEGASEVIEYSAVTYSNDSKIKMGVSKETITNYSVYSIETAHDMAKAITAFSNADYGVGITGKLNREDQNNEIGDDKTVYISIYDCEKNKYYDSVIKVTKETRKENKQQVVENVKELFLKNI